MASATAEPTDPLLQETAWDLEPLVDGEGEEGVSRRLADVDAHLRAALEAGPGSS